MKPQTRLLIGALLEQLGAITGGFSGFAGLVIAAQNWPQGFPPLAIALILLGTVLTVLSKTFFSNAWIDLADKEREKQAELVKLAETKQATEERAEARREKREKEAEKLLPTASREVLTARNLFKSSWIDANQLRYYYPEFFDEPDITFNEAWEIIQEVE
ncbi:hypothetical protein [Natronococcus wangiae]|uniref:hypothetical protein n=1 Tax=Natronococcus wangiae TaxID=3068275 RepID=UPI00273F882E|nr:hypothetical protein [Natronococcus sp. AD5]